MKGGKEEEGKGKAPMEPMFPRIHVNDREKGGPRAPPRNKMALYEQLTIPSKRPNSSSAMTQSSVRASEIQANDHERMVLSPPNIPPKPHSNSEDRVSRSSAGVIINTQRTEFGRSFKRHASNNTVNARGSARKSVENIEDDDFTVPTIVSSEISSFPTRDLPATQSENPTTHHVERSRERCYQLPTSNAKCFEENNPSTNSRNYEQGTSSLARSQEIPVPRRFAESSTRDHTGTHLANKELHPESCGDDYVSGSWCSERIDLVEEKDDSRNIVGSFSKASFAKKCDKFDQETQDKPNDVLQLGDDNDNNEVNEVSEDSIVDSIGLMISPDDVVGVIGTKHFWKARRAIVNQQRVFAIQVFELHRLIKVQKLISASPDVIDIPPMKTVSTDLQPDDIPEAPQPREDIVNSHLPTVQRSDSCENPMGDPHISRAEPQPVGFHLPPNQWLVPVMSPSEGLIYKPYASPCPPVNTFFPPFYGGLTNFAYRPPDYFPPFYSLPMPKQMFSSPSVEQVSGSHPRKLESVPCRGDRRTRVMKVVPRNAGSARESAGRILMSIQTQRQQSK